MSLDKVIDTINDLNKQGIELTETNEPDRYSKALALHEDAASLVKDNSEVHPDYILVTGANIVYAMRHLINDRVELENILRDTEREWMKRICNMKFERPHFGQARLHEEMGLVMRFSRPEDNPLPAIRESLQYLDNAAREYSFSLKEIDISIVDEAEINKRSFRIHGLLSMAYLNVHKIGDSGGHPFCNEDPLEESLKFAKEEIELRKNNGESEGHDLMNAYHTYARALIEKGIATRENRPYIGARHYLNEAMALTDNKRVRTVLTFRHAWLDFNQREGSGGLHQSMDNLTLVIKNQQHLTDGDRNVLKKELFKMANFFKGDHLKGVQGMYFK